MSCWMTCSGRRAGRAPAPASRARRATTAARSRACRRRSFPASHSKRMRILATEQQTAEAPRGGGHHQRREAAASAGTGRGAGEATGKKRSLRRSLSWAEASVKAHIVREAQFNFRPNGPHRTPTTRSSSVAHTVSELPVPPQKSKRGKEKEKKKKRRRNPPPPTRSLSLPPVPSPPPHRRLRPQNPRAGRRLPAAPGRAMPVGA
jgi:hypothetical protein